MLTDARFVDGGLGFQNRVGPGEIPLEPPVAFQFGAQAARRPQGRACFWSRRSLTLSYEHAVRFLELGRPAYPAGELRAG
jgi:hypothetical protein